MTLKEMPKVGEKVRYTSVDGYDFMTEGNEYEVTEVHKDRFVIFDDDGDTMSWYMREFDNFELVDEGTPVESPQDVIELLANISRRLYEAERQLKSQAYEINELYKAVSDRE